MPILLDRKVITSAFLGYFEYFMYFNKIWSTTVHLSNSKNYELFTNFSYFEHILSFSHSPPPTETVINYLGDPKLWNRHKFVLFEYSIY